MDKITFMFATCHLSLTLFAYELFSEAKQRTTTLLTSNKMNEL